MTFEQYVPVSDSEMVFFIILGAVIGAAFSFAVFGIRFRDTKPSKHIIPGIALFAIMAGIAGGFFGLNAHQTENAQIFQSNVAQKYTVDEVKFAMNDNHKIKENKQPTEKGEQKVTLVVQGKDYPALLVQDEKTNEPTFKNLDTKAPITDFLK